MFSFGASRSFLKIPSQIILLTTMAKKGYSSFEPVRYVPGAYTQSKKTQKAPPLEISHRKGAILVEDKRRLKDKKYVEEVLGFDDGDRFQDGLFDDGKFKKPSHSSVQAKDPSQLHNDFNNYVRDDDFRNESEVLLVEGSKSSECTNSMEHNKIKIGQDVVNVKDTELLEERSKKWHNSSGSFKKVPTDNNQTNKALNSLSMEIDDGKRPNLVGKMRSKGHKQVGKDLRCNDERFHDKSYNEEFGSFPAVKPSHSAQGEEHLEVKDDFGFYIQDDDYGKLSELPMEDDPNSSVNMTPVQEGIATEIRKDIEKKATELLAARAFTSLELRKKLNGKRYPLPLVDAVISDMKSRGLLNDGLYAEAFAQSRWLSSNWGPRRIKQVLVQKGVSVKEADKAAREVFEDDPSCSDGGMQFGMSKVSMDRLFHQASKQWMRGQDKCIEARKARIARWLQYRGFDWRVTTFILRTLQSQLPSDI